MPGLLRRWIAWGIGEILLTLCLAAIAPIFINSAYPWIGFLLWLLILLLWFTSACAVLSVVYTAYRVQQFFLRHFPEERDRSLFDFIGLSLPQVRQGVADWQFLQTDEDFKAIDISPLEFIVHSPKRHSFPRYPRL
ncbi:MAG: hypothetical protein ACO3EZ_02060 [Prochlorotrichaceae cyanobacterium]|jgi:hypothetical protein